MIEQILQMLQGLPPQELMALHDAIGQMLQSQGGGQPMGPGGQGGPPMGPGGGGAGGLPPEIMEMLLSQQVKRGGGGR